MDLDLKDKVVLIAGGSKGFGAATARRMASEGAKLMLSARGHDALQAVADEIRTGHGAVVETSSRDLTSSEDADALVDETVERFGRIDVLVTSVGAAGGGVFQEIDDRTWNEALGLKFMGNVRMLRATIPVMQRQKSGRIVVIVGQLGKQPHPRLLPSAAANAALLTVVKGAADEVAPDGVIINAVNPGPSRTDRWNNLMRKLADDTGRSVADIEADYTNDIPLGRFGEPDEIARHVCFLASDAAGYMTGTSVTTDGGWIKLPA